MAAVRLMVPAPHLAGQALRPRVIVVQVPPCQVPWAAAVVEVAVQVIKVRLMLLGGLEAQEHPLPFQGQRLFMLPAAAAAVIKQIILVY